MGSKQKKATSGVSVEYKNTYCVYIQRYKVEAYINLFIYYL